jgi:transposase InsO family protein
MLAITSTQTIDRLRTIFNRYGVPAQVMTDNDPQFASAEFQLFLKPNGIKHMLPRPHSTLQPTVKRNVFFRVSNML